MEINEAELGRTLGIGMCGAFMLGISLQLVKVLQLNMFFAIAITFILLLISAFLVALKTDKEIISIHNTKEV